MRRRRLSPRAHQGLRLAAIVALGGLLVGGGLLFAWTRELPAFDTLKDYEPLVSTRVFGANGKVVFEFARERRTVVPLQEIPDVLKRAVLAAEDARFYEHEGLNYLAIGRCVVKGLLGGGVKCGGSTITQQVVKTFLLQSDSRVKRKVKELVLAPRLERNLSKDEILYLYLNQIYLGHLRYGVEEASRFYFGKGVKSLTLGEAAMLAGVIQSPMRWSPVNHPTAAKERQRYVLRRMHEEGWISKAQYEAELARPIVVSPPEADPPGIWYQDAVRKYLVDKYGEDRVDTAGLQVDVAMDPVMQRYADSAIDAGLRQVDKRQGWRGPLLHLDRERLAAAIPLWRKRLEAVEPRPGEVLVWDLGRVNPEQIDPGEDQEKDVARMARAKPLQTGEIYAGLVTRVDDKAAQVDLGNARGEIPFSDVRWARKWNPAVGTAAPKRMGSVLSAGDVVLVRVMPAKLPPERAARERRPLALSLEQTPKVQGALVAIDPVTRGVRALVGGLDYQASQFNRALQAKRQPGSAMKPFVWGAALESRRYTPGTVVYDTPDVYRDQWTGKEWKPRNFERDEFDGPMLLGAALAHSKNTVAVKLLDTLGVDAVIGFARRMGIASDLPRNLTLALGTGEVYPIELVNAYASIAAHGFSTPPLLVLRVRDRTGKVLEETRPAQPPPLAVAPAAAVPASAADTAADAAADASATDAPAAEGAPPDAPAAPPAPPFVLPSSGTRPDVAFVLTSLMRQVVESGTGVAARALARPTAGKTGTAQDHRDAWFVGFTPELVTGVWIGFDDNSPLGGHETGAGAALPPWLAFMQAAVGGHAVAEFRSAPGIEYARIDPATGLRAPEGEANALLLPFLAGTAPTQAPAASSGAAPQNFFMDDR
ncbi:penicillin-binding protein 1A [Anaeromyxobacter oryzisoli]|uniref:penicillin-binding protein 1A n=1 Tax=Anaeromyxobacter oryzisoli TaxID=2925408 RepID=UPI0027E091EF|nr:PBP1A family penicillin-binding protein [Anaeromyxobacter sp. SG63]